MEMERHYSKESKDCAIGPEMCSGRKLREAGRNILKINRIQIAQAVCETG